MSSKLDSGVSGRAAGRHRRTGWLTNRLGRGSVEIGQIGPRQWDDLALRATLPSYAMPTSAGRLLGLSATRERSAAVASWKAAGCEGVHVVESGGRFRST